MVFQKMFEERGVCQQYHELLQLLQPETKKCTLDLLYFAAEKSLNVFKLFQCCSMVKPDRCALINILYSISASVAGHLEVGCAVNSKNITMIRGERMIKLRQKFEYTQESIHSVKILFSTPCKEIMAMETRVSFHPYIFLYSQKKWSVTQVFSPQVSLFIFFSQLLPLALYPWPLS